MLGAHRSPTGSDLNFLSPLQQRTALSVGVFLVLAIRIRSEVKSLSHVRRPPQVKPHDIPHNVFNGTYDIGGKAETIDCRLEI